MTLSQFHYQGGVLHAEQIPVADLIAEYGSPLYVYSATQLVQNYRAVRAAFAPIEPQICYSVKSCGNVGVLKVLAKEGAGMDIVSGGELQRALAAGVAPERIVFAGVGKSREEIKQALAAGIFMFNVESAQELDRLQAAAAAAGKKARVALRVNIDVADPDTHAKTATGGRHTKFGIPLEQAQALYLSADRSALEITGIHIHLGSPIPSPQTYTAALDKVSEVIMQLRQAGHEVTLVNIGGGYPVSYRTPEDNEVPSIGEVGARICDKLRALRGQGVKFAIEPGRVISATAGMLLSSVEYVKQGWDRRIAILDTGMNSLIRPTLYGAHHPMWPASYEGYSGSWGVCATPGAGTEEMDVVGPICETGDSFALQRRLPPLVEGDVMAIFCAGAYGMSQASQYNSRPRPAEVLVEGTRSRVVRRRESYKDLLEHEVGGL
jgi:diaminopimelate decarboxylase